MRYLKENTATRVTVGPFLDVGDGITPETSLTPANEQLTLAVDDAGVPVLSLDAVATTAGNNDLIHIASDVAGLFDLELTAANVNYTGRALLCINYLTQHLPVWHEFQIVSANVYDSLTTDGDVLDVSATQINGNATSAANLALSALGIIASATKSGTLSTTDASTDITGYLADELVGSQIIFTGGQANGQRSWITDFVVTNGVLTWSPAIITQPLATDTFVLV